MKNPEKIVCYKKMVSRKMQPEKNVRIENDTEKKLLVLKNSHGLSPRALKIRASL